jgi:2-oxo-4-hydroxy-4-carboxy--5-ureidoimidazoline (OHCU) decarboxylase
MANTHNRSNVIPFPVPSRVSDKDQLIQEIANIFNSADSRAEPARNDQVLARLERVAAQLERIAEIANA